MSGFCQLQSAIISIGLLSLVNGVSTIRSNSVSIFSKHAITCVFYAKKQTFTIVYAGFFTAFKRTYFVQPAFLIGKSERRLSLLMF